MSQKAKVLILGLVTLAIVIGGGWLKYAAYKQRFPNVSSWTFFFQP